MKINTHDSPILIISAPRSGSSLLSYVLNEEGIQVGITKRGDRFNPNGYFENLQIRDVIIDYLKSNDDFELGKKFNPIDLNADMPNFKNKITDILVDEKIQNDKPWLFKDPKNTFAWMLWNKYYPDAKWILLNRNTSDIINSFFNTDFMDACNSLECWVNYLSKFRANMSSIKHNCKNVFEFDIESLFNADEDKINSLFDFIGINNTGKYKNCVETKIPNIHIVKW